MKRKMRVGVIFGGRSGEHLVSLASAQSVIGAMKADQYDVVPIGITPEGRWLVSGDPMKMLQAGQPGDAEALAGLLADPAHQEVLELIPGPHAAGQLHTQPLDVVIPVLHGTYGEDGTIQGLLEMANIPYVGCGVLASAVAMDKAAAKDVFTAHGFPQVRHLVIKRKRWQQTPDLALDQIEAEIGYDCFIKPACLGSSVGINKAHNRDELRAALDVAAGFDRKIVVEQSVDAREIEVAVLGNDEPIASVPGEIVPCKEFYDYEAKYINDRSDLLIPAPISATLAAQAREAAIQAYLSIDGAGLSRVDFLLDRKTDTLYLNEINTLPGFTAISMYPKLWEASGISYSDLIDRLIDLAMERHTDKNRSRTTFAPEAGATTEA